MGVRVFESAAGGRFPQWNRVCPNTGNETHVHIDANPDDAAERGVLERRGMEVATDGLEV
ncbi:hypothetical protein [Parasphingorhabdus pacifica]